MSNGHSTFHIPQKYSILSFVVHTNTRNLHRWNSFDLKIQYFWHSKQNTWPNMKCAAQSSSTFIYFVLHVSHCLIVELNPSFPFCCFITHLCTIRMKMHWRPTQVTVTASVSIPFWYIYTYYIYAIRISTLSFISSTHFARFSAHLCYYCCGFSLTKKKIHLI